jgi:ABC-type sugar transport system substrate-binding protein
LKGTHRLLALCAALALVVAACGGDDESSSGGSASSSGGGEKKNYKMTLVAGVKGDEFYITMNCGAQAKAKELGVTLDFQGPDEFDASQQTPIVNAVAAKKPDAMLIAPTDTKAMYAPIKQVATPARRSCSSTPRSSSPDFAVSQIASDNKGGGAAAADTLKELMGGSGKVYVINVKPGHLDHRPARAGLRRAGQEIGLTYVGRDYSNDKPEVGGRQGQGRRWRRPGDQGHLRHQPVLRGGRGDRRARGRRQGRQDRRLRRRSEAGRGPQAGHRAGPDRPEAGRDRRRRRRSRPTTR